MDGTRIGSFFDLKFNPNLDPNSTKFQKVDSIKYFAKNQMEIKFDTYKLPGDDRYFNHCNQITRTLNN